MAREDGVEAVPPRRVGKRARDELHEVEPGAGQRLDRAVEAPGRWSVKNENAVRGSTAGPSRVYDAIETKRVQAWPSPTSSASTVRPYSRAASGLAIAASGKPPPSATCCAASAVVAAATVSARGSPARNRRHWSNAAGCERIARRLSSGTGPRAASTWWIGSTASATIESGARARRSCVSATEPASVLSIGSTPYEASAPATESATARKLALGTSSASGKSLAAAAALCAPGRPG